MGKGSIALFDTIGSQIELVKGFQVDEWLNVDRQEFCECLLRTDILKIPVKTLPADKWQILVQLINSLRQIFERNRKHPFFSASIYNSQTFGKLQSNSKVPPL